MPISPSLRSVRIVLTAWYTTLLVVAFTLFAISTYFYLQSLLLQTLDDDLTGETEWVLKTLAPRRDTAADSLRRGLLPEAIQSLLDDHFIANPRNYIVMIALRNGAILYQSEDWANLGPPPADTLRHRPAFSSRNSPQGGVRTCVNWQDPYIVQIAYPERPVDLALDHLSTIFAILAPLVIVFSASGGWLLAKLALRPIDSITDMANRITAHNLAERIPGRDVPDEIGRLIRTINNMIGRLQQSFTQIRQFSLNIAHELRTPLTILKGESELALRKQESNDETRQLAGIYLEETVRLSRIVDDLLTLAKTEAGQIKIQHEPLEWDKLVREVFEDAQLLSSSRELSVALNHNDPVILTGDSARLRQLLRNLVINAIQYTPPGGSIGISSVLNGDSVEISVRDTGIGIAPTDLPHIFQPFYRSERAHHHAMGGSGLGLAISQWIAHAHGGTILVASTQPGGSTFTVILPVRPPHLP